MADKNNTKEEKRLRVITEQYLSLVIDKANQEGVTGDEYKGLTQTTTGFVLVYYR